MYINHWYANIEWGDPEWLCHFIFFAYDKTHVTGTEIMALAGSHHIYWTRAAISSYPLRYSTQKKNQCVCIKYYLR